jgi:hypothetical protein
LICSFDHRNATSKIWQPYQFQADKTMTKSSAKTRLASLSAQYPAT